MDTEKAPDLDPALREIIRSERRKGFLKGLNVALAILALLCAVYVALHVSLSMHQFEEVFKQVNVPMPALTMIVLNYHGAIVSLLVMANLACLGLSIKWGDRWAVALPTLACFFLTTVWLAMCTTGLFLPLVKMLEGIGGRR